MIALEVWRLRKLCDKHGIDYQEIDDTLTYWENKEHLLTLMPFRLLEIDIPEKISKAEIARYNEYVREHFLEYYLSHQKAGQTKSKEVGEPYYPRFSLVRWIGKINRSNYPNVQKSPV